MKRFILGLVSALAVSLPVTANAQSYDPFPPTPGCKIIDGIACYTEEDGNPFILTIPSGYNQRYMLGVTPVENGVMLFMFDRETDETVSSIMFHGDIDLKYEVLEESVDLLEAVR
jgi:hypothetical protein